MALTLETLDITDTDLYVRHGYPWEAWDLLRREAPVYWYQRPGFEPFWAITRHEDVGWVSKHPELFSNAQRLRLTDIEGAELGERGRELNARKFGGSVDDPPDLVFMDPPVHRRIRAVTASKFTPNAMKLLEVHFDALSRDYLADFGQVLAERLRDGEPVDFVHELAAKLPVAAICEMADVPREDWEKIFRWSEVLIGSGDPEYQKPGKGREATGRENFAEMSDYLERLIEKRRADGARGDDLVSMLLRARIDGQPFSRRELLSYLFLLLAAGNETTRNATTGGLKALLDHPGELRKLCDDPSLVTPAVEEILRWTSIVIQFARTCIQDTELRGQKIGRGETVALWYASANRDEAVFEDPYRFDVTRDPNPHYAFGGYGEHFCLGANLARWELRTMFRALLPMLPRLELTGEPELVAKSLHVGGIKRLPVRYRRAA